MLAFFAAVAGALIGSLYDPLTWALIGSILIGALLLRMPAWSPAAIAIALTLLHIAMVYSWWVEIGVAGEWSVRVARVLAVKLVWAYAAYGLANSLRRLSKRSS